MSITAGNFVAQAHRRPGPAPWATVPRNEDHVWNTAQTLHVAAAYSNPFRWASRRALFIDFRRHMEQQDNVVLHVAEIAYGDRPFEVTRADNPNDLRFRSATELFHKENLCNLAIRHFPAGWKYGAILDGDFHMTRQDWALETIHQLQHHPWVQLYSSLAYLGPDYRPHRITPSFAWNWWHNRSRCLAGADAPGAIGGGWAFTFDGLETTGGLLEICILGSGDWHMGFGLVGRSSGRRELEAAPPGYGNAIRAWQARAAALGGNIGCVPNHAVHFWHGMLKKRGYGDRVDTLIEHGFDPTTDICHDPQGVLRLTGNKPKFRDDIRAYFRSREEDESGCNEQPLV